MVAKHRRAGTGSDSAPPRPVREMLIWTAFGCALVPLALLWSGAGWAVSLGVGGLMVLLAAGCALALRLTGFTLGPVEPSTAPGHGDDDRLGEP